MRCGVFSLRTHFLSPPVDVTKAKRFHYGIGWASTSYLTAYPVITNLPAKRGVYGKSSSSSGRLKAADNDKYHSFLANYIISHEN